MLQTQPLDIKDFSGGITDYIYTDDLSKAQVLNNLVLLKNKTPLTRPGSELDDETNPQIPAGVQRVGTLINYNNSTRLFVQSGTKFYYRNTSAYTTLQGPTSNDVFTSGSTANRVSHTEWNRHIYVTHDGFPRPQKIYHNGSGVPQVRTSGLPELASSPTCTPGAGARSYVYYFHYFYSYTIGTQVFESVGPVKTVSVSSAAEPSSSTLAITNIPVLSNSTTDNWDTTAIKVKVYRTINGGVDGFYVGEVTNGTTSLNDSNSDATILNNEPLYINDGTLDWDPPPLSKYVHVVNNIGYYAHLKDGSQVFPNSYRASIPFAPDAVPIDFEDEVEDEITGFSSVASLPIILCKKYIYRIEGQFDQYGRGFMTHVRISDNAGCVSNESVVQAEGGLFWAGNDGFYYTDGYKVMKISEGNDENYANMLEACTNVLNIQGRFDERNRRILWACQTDSSTLDNDTIFCLELKFGIRPDSTFTTWTGEATGVDTSFSPSAIEFFNKKLYRGDKRGYVFVHDDTIYTDPRVDTLVTPADWEVETIMYRYRSVALNFGSNFVRKWVPRILLTAKNRGNVSIQITAINDDGKLSRECVPIRWRKNFTWGDPEFVWGSETCVWNIEGLIEEWRRLPAGGLRLSYLQVEVSNGLVVVTNSDIRGQATFNSTGPTVTLDDVTKSWPDGAVGYFISSEDDGYVRQYEVLSQAGNVLTVSNIYADFPTGSKKWLLKGYVKGERLNLLSYTVHYALLSKTQSTYETGQDGANA